jgi:hypothetical protein
LRGATVQDEPRFRGSGNQAALAPGAGKITGQLFARTVGGEVKYGAGSTVYLYPMTAYVVEAQAATQSRQRIENLDSRVISMARTTVADGSGNFSFDKLKGGQYIVESEVKWSVCSAYGCTQTGGVARRVVNMPENGEAVQVMLTP